MFDAFLLDVQMNCEASASLQIGRDIKGGLHCNQACFPFWEGCYRGFPCGISAGFNPLAEYVKSLRLATGNTVSLATLLRCTCVLRLMLGREQV